LLEMDPTPGSSFFSYINIITAKELKSCEQTKETFPEDGIRQQKKGCGPRTRQA
jgi:hypothetical protein